MRLPKLPIVALLGVVVLLAGACSSTGASTTTTTLPDKIVLMTHDSFAISQDVLDQFQAQTGVPVEILQSGDAGTMLNQAILTKDAPLADALYGIDNTFLGRALREDLFVPYTSPSLVDVDQTLIPTDVDPDHRVTPIDDGDVCINTDLAAFTDTAPPQTLEDLTDPKYRNMLVVEDPATSSPGLAFLLATIARFPDGSGYDWKAYWKDLVANGVEIVPGWEQAYYGRFSGGSGKGDRPLVVSYATSPVAEVYFSDLTEAPTGVMTDGCFRQVEYVGILRGTKHEELARKLVDFMLSEPFQADIPLNMFVYPSNVRAPLPDVFVNYGEKVPAPITLDPQAIDEHREEWIRTWTQTVR